MAFVNIGFGNMVNSDKIVAIVSPDAAPIKRLVQHAKEAGTAIDATQGRRHQVCDDYRRRPCGFIGASAGYNTKTVSDCG